MKKKFITTILLALSMVLLVACSLSNKTTNEPKNVPSQTVYHEKLENLENLEQITLVDVVEKLNSGESFIILFARPTCPYCRIFAPKLYDAVASLEKDNTNIKIYYVNTDEENTDTFKDFAYRNKIKTVPNLSYFAKGVKVDSLEKGSQSTVQETIDFLNQYKWAVYFYQIDGIIKSINIKKKVYYV